MKSEEVIIILEKLIIGFTDMTSQKYPICKWLIIKYPTANQCIYFPSAHIYQWKMNQQKWLVFLYKWDTLFFLLEIFCKGTSKIIFSLKNFSKAVHIFHTMKFFFFLNVKDKRMSKCKLFSFFFLLGWSIRELYFLFKSLLSLWTTYWLSPLQSGCTTSLKCWML